MSQFDASSLVNSAVAGDKQAFGELVLKYAGLVTGVAYTVCGDFARSEDIGQEAFLEAWKNLATLREPAKFSSWLCAIARRRAIDAVRRLKSRPAAELRADPIDPANLNPEAMMVAKQERDFVWSMLERLPETYLETMVLYYRGEQSVSEVAAALDENEATVRQRLKRGRDLLRSEFTDTIADTLKSTVPKAAFAAAVMATLPSVTYAAGATGAAGAVTGKAGVGVGGMAATAFGGAIFGSLLGIAGGIFGTWCSWRNAEYKSQQDFIVRTTVHFFIGLIVFLVLLGGLLWFRLNGFLENGVYLVYYLGLMAIWFVFSGIWMWRCFSTYKRIENEAIATGEPRRPEVAKKLDELREKARTVRKDGQSGYEAFQWNAGSWFGAMLGCTAWMVPTAGILFARSDWIAASIVVTCFAIAIVSALVFWNQQANVKARVAMQWMMLILGVMTAIVFVAFQFLASSAFLAAIHWSPWYWLLLLLFPALAIQFYFIQRSTVKRMLEQDRLAHPKRSDAD